MAQAKNTLPLVYSCSGCSSAAQLANHLAVRLDRDERAEMSCIAGVGGSKGTDDNVVMVSFRYLPFQ